MNINEFLSIHKKITYKAGFEYRKKAPRVQCKDGFSMSVQVSSSCYCIPRTNDANLYYQMEVGYPSEQEDLLMPYADDRERPTDTIYGYVPVNVIENVIEKHGGIVVASGG